jgi:hypothetical protein
MPKLKINFHVVGPKSLSAMTMTKSLKVARMELPLAKPYWTHSSIIPQNTCNCFDEHLPDTNGQVCGTPKNQIEIWYDEKSENSHSHYRSGFVAFPIIQQGKIEIERIQSQHLYGTATIGLWAATH